MRLGPFLLIPACLAAQVPAPKFLPWERLQEPPWQLAEEAPGDQAPPPAPVSGGAMPLRVELRGDGSLRVVDPKGLVTLRGGLPGRPVKAWRDAGVPLDLAAAWAPFPAASGLDGGLGSLPLAPGEDFRPMLSGLLWVLDDGERLLTLLNPARGQVVYLPLPAGGNPDLRFHREHLEVWTGAPSPQGRRERMVWRLPWAALLPQFLTLATPRATGTPGTALKPFPTE